MRPSRAGCCSPRSAWPPGSTPPATLLGDDNVLVLGSHRVDLAALKQSLVDRGFGDILCEGGPHLLRDLLDQGVADELDCTFVPRMVAGTQPRITDGPPVDVPLQPAHPGRGRRHPAGSLVHRLRPWARAGAQAPLAARRARRTPRAGAERNRNRSAGPDPPSSWPRSGLLGMKYPWNSADDTVVPVTEARWTPWKT